LYELQAVLFWLLTNLNVFCDVIFVTPFFADAMVQELKDISLQRVGATVVGPHPVVTSSGHRVPSSTAVPGVRLDPEGLIIPKKIPNPCVESREVMDLNREIKWNAKT
jgi:hypothetical protein